MMQALAQRWKNWKQPSLMRRLLLAQMGVVALLWTMAIALLLYDSYEDPELLKFDKIFQTVMAIAKNTADRPDKQQETIAAFDAALLETVGDGDAASDTSPVLQVWQGDRLIYRSTAAVPVILNTVPNRISMNVTVPKQTQGATFGEKVNAGLHAAGGALSQGASLRIDIACDGRTCLIAFPDGQAVRADLQAMTLTPVDGQVATPAALQGVVPGAGIVSAAVSSVSALGGATGGAAAASYAATGRMAGAPAALPARTVAPDRIDVTQPLADGDYQLSLVVEKATSGLKDTLKTQVRTMAMAPARVRIELAFQVQDGVLRTRHETAKNSISNIR